MGTGQKGQSKHARISEVSFPAQTNQSSRRWGKTAAILVTATDNHAVSEVAIRLSAVFLLRSRAMEDVSFTLSSSSADGAAAAVADGSSSRRTPGQSLSSGSSESNTAPSPIVVREGGDGRSRSPPSSQSRLPPMPEDSVVPFAPEESTEMQLVGGLGEMFASASARRGSPRDAARVSARSPLPVYPRREPMVLGSWMGAVGQLCLCQFVRCRRRCRRCRCRCRLSLLMGRW